MTWIGTTEVEGYEIPGRRGEKIYLIDTPGFDDTQISYVELLRTLAAALGGMSLNGDVRFAGFVYLHRITDQRVSGSSLESLRIFEKICGEENFPYVVLATSMWNLLGKEGDRDLGEARKLALKKKNDFFWKNGC
jgi:hypothetical protein